MIKQYSIIFAVVITIIFIGAACSNDEQPPPPAGTSVGGAQLETGLDIDDQWEIVFTQTTFQANEEFHFNFNNNTAFDSELVTVQLIGNSNEKVLAESDYEVDPDDYSVTDKIWFGSPGRYTIVVKVGGEVRATQEVIIEE